MLSGPSFGTGSRIHTSEPLIYTNIECSEQEKNFILVCKSIVNLSNTTTVVTDLLSLPQLVHVCREENINKKEQEHTKKRRDEN